MERLTFGGKFCDIARCGNVPGGSFCEDGSCYRRKVWERLKHYEDLEEQGRLVVLPCKVGDIIYRVGDPVKPVYEWEIEHIEIYMDEVVFYDDSDNRFVAEDIGKTVFLCREDAEKAMEGGKQDESQGYVFQ